MLLNSEQILPYFDELLYSLLFISKQNLDFFLLMLQ